MNRRAWTTCLPVVGQRASCVRVATVRRPGQCPPVVSGNALAVATGATQTACGPQQLNSGYTPRLTKNLQLPSHWNRKSDSLSIRFRLPEATTRS